MSLNDFGKLNNKVVEEDKDKFVDDIEFEDFVYYIYHVDKLIDLVKESYIEYVEAKLRFEFKKSKLQTTINWSDENNLRVANGLPKCTNQDQKNASIDMKLKSMKNEMNNCEMKYKFYNKIFTFISNNFELLCDMYELKEKLEDDSEN